MKAHRLEVRALLTSKTPVDSYRGPGGLACHVESTGGGSREHASLAIGPDGVVAVHTGSSSTGQGIATSFAQIATGAKDRSTTQRLGSRTKPRLASAARITPGLGGPRHA